MDTSAVGPPTAGSSAASGLAGPSTSSSSTINKKTSNNFTTNGMKSRAGPGSTSGTATAKKLVIKNFSTPKLPDNYLESTWELLREAVVAIQTSRPISTPLEELYHVVENLCSHKMGAKLYSNLEALVCGHVKVNINQFPEGMDVLTFLKSIDNCWQSHCRQMVCLHFVFSYFHQINQFLLLFNYSS